MVNGLRIKVWRKNYGKKGDDKKGSEEKGNKEEIGMPRRVDNPPFLMVEIRQVRPVDAQVRQLDRVLTGKKDL